MIRILLADDHPMIRTAIDVLLRDTRYELAGTAANGEQALDQVERLKPDIVLLDLANAGRPAGWKSSAGCGRGRSTVPGRDPDGGDRR